MPLTKKFMYTKEELDTIESGSYRKLIRFYEQMGEAIRAVNIQDVYTELQVNEILGNANAILGCCSHLKLCARERLKRRSL